MTGKPPTPRSRTADQVMVDFGQGRAEEDPYDEMAVLIAEVVRLRAKVAALQLPTHSSDPGTRSWFERPKGVSGG